MCLRLVSNNQRLLYPIDQDTLAVHIDAENFEGLKVPSGNESGTNRKWIPGGYTSGDVPEAVMDFSHKPAATELDID